jgi:hypothetical protein
MNFERPNPKKVEPFLLGCARLVATTLPGRPETDLFSLLPMPVLKQYKLLNIKASMDFTTLISSVDHCATGSCTELVPEQVSLFESVVLVFFNLWKAGLLADVPAAAVELHESMQLIDMSTEVKDALHVVFSLSAGKDLGHLAPRSFDAAIALFHANRSNSVYRVLEAHPHKLPIIADAVRANNRLKDEESFASTTARAHEWFTRLGTCEVFVWSEISIADLELNLKVAMHSALESQQRDCHQYNQVKTLAKQLMPKILKQIAKDQWPSCKYLVFVVK